MDATEDEPLVEAEDLLANVFPDQVACGENLVGDREVPDHPLVSQTIADCLHEAMDIDGLENVLRKIEGGEIEVVARDLTEPSPLALEVLGARPYAYLDDAPLEERRTQAVMARRWLDPETAADLGQLDADAIRRAVEELRPEARNADELHDALMSFGFLIAEEVSQWPEFFDTLLEQKRATTVKRQRKAKVKSAAARSRRGSIRSGKRGGRSSRARAAK